MVIVINPIFCYTVYKVVFSVVVIRSYLFLLVFFHQNNPPNLRFWFFYVSDCTAEIEMPSTSPGPHTHTQLRLHNFSNQTVRVITG